MFLEPDEYIIIMDMNERDEDVSLTLNEMKMLKSAGVKTLYFQGLIRLDRYQPDHDSEMDWSEMDGFVERGRAAGLKMLIPFLFSIPDWLPDDYFLSRKTNGQLYPVPNYANDEVTKEIDWCLSDFMRRYNGADVQFVYAIPGNGEFAFNGHNRMECDMEVFTSWVVDRQRILAGQYNEVWTAFHPYYNPVYWEPLYGALFSAFPHARHYGIIFTYVQHEMAHFHKLLNYTRGAGMVYYGGTEYVQGIRRHLPKLLESKTRMLTAPKHPYQQYKKVEPWMLEKIEWAIQEYRKVM